MKYKLYSKQAWTSDLQYIKLLKEEAQQIEDERETAAVRFFAKMQLEGGDHRSSSALGRKETKWRGGN